jgi:LacI family transcriptional regulator
MLLRSVTIRVIADAAGVSRGTVDKVLNDRPGVSTPVRERVRKLAAELGYKPNLAGKSLAFQKNPLRIGFILLKGGDPFFQEIREGVDQAALELAGFGIEVDCRMMAGASVAEQVECIRALAREHLAALVLSPLDDPAVAEELNRLAAGTGIRIVTCNTDLPSADKLCFVGQPLRKSGRVAGDLMAKLLPRGGDVLVVSGLTQIKAHRDRLEGFVEVLAEEHPGVRIVHTIHDVGDDGMSHRAVAAYLSSHPAPQAIYLTGLGIAGVGRALRERGRPEIRVVCYDRVPETVALLKDGIIDFTITQDPFMQGYLPVKLLFDYLFNGNVPATKDLYTRIEIVTRENV